jgi:hypothetical protein
MRGSDPANTRRRRRKIKCMVQLVQVRELIITGGNNSGASSEDTEQRDHIISGCAVSKSKLL